MMWSTNSGISFFGGFGRLPLPPGKKGRVIGLLLAAGSVLLLLVLAYLFAWSCERAAGEAGGWQASPLQPTSRLACG